MASPRDNPGVIAPPPILFLGMLAFALAIDFWVLRLRTGLPETLRYVVAAVLIAAAVLLALGAIWRFRSAGTHVEPWRPSTAIVTEGVYRRTRNPMYLSMTLLYLAVALAADSVVALILLAPLLLVVNIGVVAREERYLERKFGDEYLRYKASVRRWV